MATLSERVINKGGKWKDSRFGTEYEISDWPASRSADTSRSIRLLDEHNDNDAAAVADERREKMQNGNKRKNSYVQDVKSRLSALLIVCCPGTTIAHSSFDSFSDIKLDYLTFPWVLQTIL